MKSQIYTCGIIGFGYMGEIRKRVADQFDELNVIGVSEVSAEKRARIKGCPAFETYEELMELDPDILFVCTPNVYSPELCIRSMQAGKHVFCEKPPGRNLQDIQNIVNAQLPGTKLMFGFNHRFHPAVLKAKAVIDAGRLGNVISLRGIYGKSGGQDFKSSWRNEKDISGGGILLDQGIHMLDIFRFLGGDFPVVKCITSKSYWNFPVEDNACVILMNEQGKLASLHSSATLWKHTFRFDVTLEEGYLSVQGLLSKSGSYGREQIIIARRQFENETEAVGNPAEELTYFDKDLSWELEMKEFISCISENKEVTISSAYDALKVMEIIDTAYKDAGTEKAEV
ncbi:Gfo/Idh/MocA family oxidoreductase [Kiloniella laminariae]|uniref:Gfo/Idh/MocA family oxidoreductase n=1 Tax=Kiloniella laminariae TaxID=454162 RepID=A0ABT4LMJ2_9PROT|nr:Gfo/Idh/MocA family oxidoreductase [Kiloniella laminariae]MCZ4282337.1 Gfo/Idh/MocA family oxidoreductase [Kiloniella laminariae]